MSALHPLRFSGPHRSYMWGGCRIRDLLGKQIDTPEETIAESWEISDHDSDQSIVTDGQLAGQTLGDLTREFGTDLLGERFHAQVNRRREASQDPLSVPFACRFPLLFKYLDARLALSVQVHPNDAQAWQLDPPDLGKTEAWVVLDALPGSRIYAGLKPGVDTVTLAQSVKDCHCEELLHSFEARVGDCIYIPAGTVHSMGGGILVAEIQQASDVTYRLYDWNRPGPDGQLRPLQTEAALQVIDFDRGPIEPTRADTGDAVSTLVSDDNFVLRSHRFDSDLTIGDGTSFHIVTVVSGEIEIEGDPAGCPLGPHQSILLPAACGDVQIRATSGPVELLESTLP